MSQELLVVNISHDRKLEIRAGEKNASILEQWRQHLTIHARCVQYAPPSVTDNVVASIGMRREQELHSHPHASHPHASKLSHRLTMEQLANKHLQLHVQAPMAHNQGRLHQDRCDLGNQSQAELIPPRALQPPHQDHPLRHPSSTLQMQCTRPCRVVSCQGCKLVQDNDSSHPSLDKGKAKDIDE